MAYIEKRNRKNGAAFVVEFRRGGRVFKLSLDKSYNIKDARFIAAAIDAAVDAEKRGSPLDARTRAIFQNLAPDVRRRLERVGLLAITQTTTFREARARFEREYFINLKSSTRTGYDLSFDNFVHFIGSDSRPVETITESEALAFGEALQAALAPNTARLRFSQLKTFFRFLELKGAVEASPFASATLGTFVAGRRRYVDRETVERIGAKLTIESRAILYLYRFAGLRKSEPYGLKFSHVNLARRRLTIPTPKTERFAGHGERVAPIAPILADALAPVVGDRTDDALIFVRRLDPKTIKRFIPDARPFQDLRASCENDWLEAGVPAHAAAQWIGHQINVQARHYAIVLDSYFERATGLKPGENFVGEIVGENFENEEKSGS